MSEQLEKLRYARPFGNVLLKTDKFRNKFHLPPSYLLHVLSSRFQAADYDHPILLHPASQWFVTKYDTGSRYTQGHTLYRPRLVIEDSTSSPEEDGLVIAIQAADNLSRYQRYDDLDVDKDSQWAYELNGHTWWPEHAVSQRIAEHDRLLTIGKQLITLVQTGTTDRNLSAYYAQKVIG